MLPDPQRNARLQAKINFPISGKRGFFFYFWLTPCFNTSESNLYILHGYDLSLYYDLENAFLCRILQLHVNLILCYFFSRVFVS
jgi:hypothetical protein